MSFTVNKAEKLRKIWALFTVSVVKVACSTSESIQLLPVWRTAAAGLAVR